MTAASLVSQPKSTYTPSMRYLYFLYILRPLQPPKSLILWEPITRSFPSLLRRPPDLRCFDQPSTPPDLEGVLCPYTNNVGICCQLSSGLSLHAYSMHDVRGAISTLPAVTETTYISICLASATCCLSNPFGAKANHSQNSF